MSQIVGRGKTINKLLNVTNQAAPVGTQDNHPVKLGRGNVVMSPKTVSKPVGLVSPPSVNRGNVPVVNWFFKLCGDTKFNVECYLNVIDIFLKACGNLTRFFLFSVVWYNFGLGWLILQESLCMELSQ